MSISKAYNDWAATYDDMPNKTRDIEMLAAKSTLNMHLKGKVLELGCGTGKNIQWMLKKAVSITGLDFSLEMMEIARNKVRSKNVEFLQTDLTKAWPVPANQFNLITCSLVLEHIKDLNFIFEQASNRLIPKGKFYICELHPFKQYTGSKARFDNGKEIQELEVFIHHMSDYLWAANKHRFKLLEIKEWFDEDNRKNIPRLISFIFEK
ncbi:methyltransferase domain-containing protein [Gillisia sp. M10.2A]|uniref:Methyltransferase domain-containing protein n=1 Tax=Gillisia lutea TaxID=2909668 RepID=A0ABS9EIR0_9FLAO|nr:class I SAM-dependent methyltransferase [Gillisia lutea]MCF4102739.1 methyltransferase domain-containing protein [Gillisia lutea]